MKQLKKFLLIIVPAFALIACDQNESSETSDSKYEERLSKYLELTGRQYQNNPIMAEYSSLPMFKNVYANSDYKNMMDSMMLDMEVRVKKIYKEELSIEELNELIKFYESPIGQKLIELDKTIMKESFKLTTETSLKSIQNIFKNNPRLDPNSERK